MKDQDTCLPEKFQPDTPSSCDYCLGTLVYVHCYGNHGANGCHESFADYDAAYRHRAKTGGCHFPGNPKLGLMYDGLCWRIRPQKEK